MLTCKVAWRWQHARMPNSNEKVEKECGAQLRLRGRLAQEMHEGLARRSSEVIPSKGPELSHIFRNLEPLLGSNLSD